jgi:hypothetical protein
VKPDVRFFGAIPPRGFLYSYYFFSLPFHFCLFDRDISLVVSLRGPTVRDTVTKRIRRSFQSDKLEVLNQSASRRAEKVDKRKLVKIFPYHEFFSRL